MPTSPPKRRTNKGRTFPPEILTPDEVATLFELIDRSEMYPVRDPLLGLYQARYRAMLALMYYAEVKIGSVLTLAVRDYDPETGVLVVPAGQKSPRHEVRLDPITRRMLDDWLERRAELRLRGTAPLFVTLRGPGVGNRVTSTDVRRWLNDLRDHARIQKRVSPEGLRASRALHRQNETGRFESMIVAYISAPGFRRTYPLAYQKWLDAHQLLETSPRRHAGTIGHLCREAVIEFSEQIAHENGMTEFEPGKTKQKIRAVLTAHGGMSRTLRRSLEALVEYWECLVDLANRQEHGRELVADDSRALIFQTMLVMREIDLALTR